MRQKLCGRLEGLEKISVAAAAGRLGKSPDYERKSADMMERAHALRADPVNQKWPAEQPPDYLHLSVHSLRAELQERADGYSGPGGFR